MYMAWGQCVPRHTKQRYMQYVLAFSSDLVDIKESTNHSLFCFLVLNSGSIICSPFLLKYTTTILSFKSACDIKLHEFNELVTYL